MRSPRSRPKKTMLRTGWMKLWKEGQFAFPLVDGPHLNPHSSLPSLSFSPSVRRRRLVGQPRSGDRDLNFSSKTQQAEEDKTRRRKIRITDHLNPRIHLLCSSKFSLGLFPDATARGRSHCCGKTIVLRTNFTRCPLFIQAHLGLSPAIFANGLKNGLKENCGLPKTDLNILRFVQGNQFQFGCGNRQIRRLHPPSRSCPVVRREV